MACGETLGKNEATVSRSCTNKSRPSPLDHMGGNNEGSKCRYKGFIHIYKK